MTAPALLEMVGKELYSIVKSWNTYIPANTLNMPSYFGDSYDAYNYVGKITLMSIFHSLPINDIYTFI